MATIQDAVKQAREGAANMTQDEPTSNGGGQVIEGSVGAGGQVTTYAKPSMATVQASSSIIPRGVPYIKVNEFGLRIGQSKEFITDPFKVKIDMTEDQGFMVKHTLRFGSPAQYLSTYDGHICDKGGTWGDALLKAQQAGGAAPYPAVDVVLTLTEKLKTGKDTLQPGAQIAFNSSKTNFSEWEDFYKECAGKDLLGQEVEAKVHFEAIQHNGNEWGVVTFTLVE